MYHSQGSTSQLWQVLLTAIFVWCQSESLWFADSAPHCPVKHNHFKVLLNWRNWEFLMPVIANEITSWQRNECLILLSVLKVPYSVSHWAKQMLTGAWARTCPTAIKPVLLRVKPWKLLCLRSGMASGAEQQWNTNQMSNVFSIAK